MLPTRRPMTQQARTCLRCRYSTNTTPPPAPPLLLKLRSDLKTAMKAKDTNRLNVLRGLLAEVTNAAKTSSPIKSDMQLLSLLRKRSVAAKAAASEFQEAGRPDLKDKEEAQAAVLEGYAGSVETVGQDEVRSTVVQVVDEMKGEEGSKVHMGDVLKRLLAPDGPFEGKPVEKAEVAKAVKEVLAA
ncbi:hypothetical protein LTR66_008671 [Elasticomyces elasticus]|nr:hypothetical protein LTR66_008671 [Elasticomyces elasticus]